MLLTLALQINRPYIILYYMLLEYTCKLQECSRGYGLLSHIFYYLTHHYKVTMYIPIEQGNFEYQTFSPFDPPAVTIFRLPFKVKFNVSLIFKIALPAISFYNVYVVLTCKRTSSLRQLTVSSKTCSEKWTILKYFC